MYPSSRVWNHRSMLAAHIAQGCRLVSLEHAAVDAATSTSALMEVAVSARLRGRAG